MRTVLTIIVGLFAIGCDSLADVQGAWEEKLRRILLPGYSDFRAEYDLTEAGVMVFSYAADAHIPQVKDHILRQYPCYSVVQESPTALKLRCTNGGRFDDLEELRFQIDPGIKRVFGLTMRQVPPNAHRYEELSSALDEVVARQK
jgi:hypothetical protein